MVTDHLPREVVDHPVFSRIYPRFAIQADRRGQAAHRAELLAGASCRVVELSAGTGRNFRHSVTVSELIAVGPSCGCAAWPRWRRRGSQ